MTRNSRTPSAGPQIAGPQIAIEHFMMNRRSFLKLSGLLSVQTIFPAYAVQSLWIPNAQGAGVSLASLHAALDPRDASVLVPSDKLFAPNQIAFNKRTIQVPLVRVLCSTAQGVAIAIEWARTNNVPLAVRSGGHSFEGLSQTTGLAIDTRPMGHVQMASDLNSFTAGGGATLGNIYTQLSTHDRAFPAGSCPTVGISGHTLGGGYGLLARPLGLACDSLISAELVNADGKTLTCSETENSDLFWALRGGGAGSFGIVTSLQMKAHRIGNVIVYGLSWTADAKVTSSLIKAWLEWASSAPREITSLMGLHLGSNGNFELRAFGQTVGSMTQLHSEIAKLTGIAPATPLTFIEAVHHFAGSDQVTSDFTKGKSDYLTRVFDDQGLATLLSNLPAGISVTFDSYGGKVADVGGAETAFADRAGTLSSIKYSAHWASATQTPTKLQQIRKFYDSMRDFVSGGAYFNYCDLDLKNYGLAYWGTNLERLTEIKAKYDPSNVFCHAQSIPSKT